jgi:hypothetical protein
MNHDRSRHRIWKQHWHAGRKVHTFIPGWVQNKVEGKQQGAHIPGTGHEATLIGTRNDATASLNGLENSSATFFHIFIPRVDNDFNLQMPLLLLFYNGT